MQPIPVIDRIEDLVGVDNAALILEGLNLLLETKQEALATVNAAKAHPVGRPFTPHDFGIPKIEKLVARFNEV